MNVGHIQPELGGDQLKAACQAVQNITDQLLAESERNNGCFLRSGADHSIEKANKVEVESISIFNPRN